MKEKQIKGAVLKHSCNVERLIEHIRQNVTSEISYEYWREKMWNGHEMLVAKAEG